MTPFWQTSRFQMDLARPRVMGIVNATPDSFADGGVHFSEGKPSTVLAHCEQLLKDGADMLDIGGESTRPGSPAVPLAQELARVLPVLRHAVTLGVPVSVDTYKPEVMQAALDLGVDIINDVWALRRPGALQVVAAGHGGFVVEEEFDPSLPPIMANADALVSELLRAAPQAPRLVSSSKVKALSFPSLRRRMA